VRRRVLPKSLLGQAIDYTLARWPALIRYVEDGRLDIDNNSCENSIRPTAVGKKNFLFIGHPEAGQRSAVIYSVLAKSAGEWIIVCLTDKLKRAAPARRGPET